MPSSFVALDQLAAVLGSLRAAAKLSQNALAERVGLSRQMISLAEKGGSGISLDTLVAWVEACGGTVRLQVTSAAGDTTAVAVTASASHRLISATDALPDDEREWMASLAEWYEQASAEDRRDLRDALALNQRLISR